jgi:putative hydrolase of the HAD superfamily
VTGSTFGAPQAVLFDLDDTLFPEHEFVDGGFRAVAAFLAARTGRSAQDLTDRLWALHRRDGRGRLFDALVEALDEIAAIDESELVRACLLVYRGHHPDLELFPGALELIERLRRDGIRTGIVSDGNAYVQSRKLAGLHGLADAFDVVVLTDLLGSGFSKPSPVPFRVACRLLDVEPSATIYVGNDPRKDFAGARAAGLRTIRFGSVPDEGGGTPVVAGPVDDADVAVDTFAALEPVLIGMTT